MNKEQFKEAIEKVRKNSPKRKFTQSFDLVINLKDINLKDTTQQIDVFLPLHFSKGKKTKVCALGGPELAKQAKEVCDFFVHHDDFEKYARDKKLTKKLANDYEFFIAQANIMPDVAKTFGRVFGPKGKMPNPKAGCVVPPTANLKPLYERLQNMVRIFAKTSPSVQVIVGNEEMKDEEVLDNIMTVFNQVIHVLPAEKNNIRNIYLKLTMGQSFRVGAKEEKEAPAPEEKPKKKTEKPSEEKSES
ncbi:50S ribosomal protein L1 [Candidatus Woesearchaeota archaeon]|nr:50S ribosomal protein L1 [Candidatus Woesearchaeota archaeon]